MEGDLYKILEIEEDVSEEELKKAYRRLSKRYHPDANPGDQKAGQMFRELTEAYAILQNPETRRQYDAARKGAAGSRNGRFAAGQGAGEGPGNKNRSRPSSSAKFDRSDIGGSFERFFGFNPESAQVNEEQLKQTGNTKTNPLDVTDLFERYMGIKKK